MAVAMLGRNEIDGRPLYKYNYSSDCIDLLEEFINHPLAGDGQKVRALAPVAAARFASNYVDGVPGWKHCGSEVERLYKMNQARFRTLMELSFNKYNVNIVRRPGADLLFETVVSQAGLPSGMLKEGQALRKVIDELMRFAAKGCDDLLSESSRLVLDAVEGSVNHAGHKLRRAYQEAGHLPQLCEELVTSTLRLTERVNWNGGSLDALWSIPNWNKELPFWMDEEAARTLVSQLLNVAMDAAGNQGLAIERILSAQYGQYTLTTRASINSEGIFLDGESRSVVAIHYTIDGEPADEALRLRGEEGKRYRPARDVAELSENLSNRQVSLALKCKEGYRSLDCAGHDPLDEDACWVFEPTGSDYIYRAPAPVRLRAKKLFVVAPEGISASGAVKKISRLPCSRDGRWRGIWEVDGEASFIGQDGEPAIVQAGYEGPQMFLDFRGRPANFNVKQFNTVFIGNPEPCRVGGLSGRIEWKISSESGWRNSPVRDHFGLLSFRLLSSDNRLLSERRRVFVFPEGFIPKITPKSVSLRVPFGCDLPDYPVDAGGYATIDFSTAQMCVRMNVSGVALDLVFNRPPAVAAFKDIVSQESQISGMKEINSLEIGRISALSGVHDSVEVARVRDRFDAVYPVPLQGNTLRLSEVKDFIHSLSFHERGRRHDISVKFRNGPEIRIRPHRIRRRGNVLTIPGACEEARIQLLPLNASVSGLENGVALERIAPDDWRLPADFDDYCQYLAVDISHQASPCFFAGEKSESESERTFLGVITIRDENERANALVSFYDSVLSSPNEARASAELHICLKWLGRFERWLSYLDPLLVLASRPELALRMLALTRIFDESSAERGLRTALNEVPFFWHRVTPKRIKEMNEWGERNFGAGSSVLIGNMFEDLDLPKMMGFPDQLRFALPAWRDAWYKAETAWRNNLKSEQLRSPRLADEYRLLWEKLDGHPGEEALRCRPRNISTDVDMFRTWLLAPQDLAIAIAFDAPLETQVRDDLLFARHMIDAKEFDSAYCASLALLESE